MCTWISNLVTIVVPIFITLILTVLVVCEFKRNNRTLYSVQSEVAFLTS